MRYYIFWLELSGKLIAVNDLEIPPTKLISEKDGGSLIEISLLLTRFARTFTGEDFIIDSSASLNSLYDIVWNNNGNLESLNTMSYEISRIPQVDNLGFSEKATHIPISKTFCELVRRYTDREFYIVDHEVNAIYDSLTEYLKY